MDALNDRSLVGLPGRHRPYRLPGYPVGIGAKGCVTFSPTKIVDYETFKANQDVEVTELAWLYNMNRGIFMTPGREEEWTLSVTHTFGDRRLRSRVRRDGRRPHRLALKDAGPAGAKRTGEREPSVGSSPPAGCCLSIVVGCARPERHLCGGLAERRARVRRHCRPTSRATSSSTSTTSGT